MLQAFYLLSLPFLSLFFIKLNEHLKQYQLASLLEIAIIAEIQEKSVLQID